MRAQTTRIRVAVLACTHKPPASKSPHAHTNRTRVAVSRFSAQEPNARRPPATRAARPSPCTIARPIRVTIQVTTLGQRPLACSPCSSMWLPSPVGAARRRRACVRTRSPLASGGESGRGTNRTPIHNQHHYPSHFISLWPGLGLESLSEILSP